MARLLLVVDGVVLKTYELDKDTFVFGRKGNADVLLDDPVVSGRHAQVIKVASDYLDGHSDFFIEDLGSTNGTLLNGKRVTRARLQHGDTIQISRHQFAFDSGQVPDLETTAIYLPDDD